MWIEAIRVRTSQAEQYKKLLQHMAALPDDSDAPRPVWCAGYQNLEVENEISIHLGWEEAAHPPAKTACGLRLARAFAQYGLVHHSIWQRTR